MPLLVSNVIHLFAHIPDYLDDIHTFNRNKNLVETVSYEIYSKIRPLETTKPMHQQVEYIQIQTFDSLNPVFPQPR